MIRLYVKGSFKGPISLTNNQLHYILNVMRRPSSFLIFNEQEGEYLAKMYDASSVQVIELLRPYQPLPYLGLAIAPLKPKAMNYVLEKATEIGVTNIFIVQTKHTGMNDAYSLKLARRFESTMIEAAEQCERMDIPKIHNPMPLNQWIKSTHQKHMYQNKWCVALERSSAQSLSHHYQGILIGPEGGFSTEEKTILQQTMSVVSLGHLILKAETAAIVGLARCKS